MDDETDNDIRRLQAVADWMRANGVVGLRLHDGTELRLDPSWHSPSDTIPAPEPQTIEQKTKELADLRGSAQQRPFRHVRLTRTAERPNAKHK